MQRTYVLTIAAFFALMSSFAWTRTATTKEEIEAESQVQSTYGDLGEQAIQKQESIQVDPLKKEKPDFDPENIIQEETPEQDR